MDSDIFGALLLPTSSSKGNEEGEEDKVCHEKSFFRQDACSDWRFAWPTRLKSGVKQVVYTSKAIVLFRSSVKEHLQKRGNCRRFDGGDLTTSQASPFLILQPNLPEQQKHVFICKIKSCAIRQCDALFVVSTCPT